MKPCIMKTVEKHSLEVLVSAGSVSANAVKVLECLERIKDIPPLQRFFIVNDNQKIDNDEQLKENRTRRDVQDFLFYHDLITEDKQNDTLNTVYCTADQHNHCALFADEISKTLDQKIQEMHKDHPNGYITEE